MPELDQCWKRYRFAEMVTSAGATRKSRGWNIEDAAVDRYVGLEHLDSNSLRIRRWGDPADVGENSDLRHFEAGDVLLARRGIDLRKVGRAHFRGVASGHALVFRAVPSVISPEFLPFFIQSDLFMGRADRRSVGSLSKTVNLSALMKEEFNLPPLDQQRRISQLLRKFDAAINRYEDLCEAHAELRESLLKHEVARHADRYGVLQAQDLLSRLTVGIVVKPTDWYTKGTDGIPALRSLNVMPGTIVEDDLVYITQEGHDKHAKSALYPGDVVVVRSGRPGDAAVIPEGVGKLNAIDLIVSTPGPGMLGQYMAAVLNSTFGRVQLASGSAGTAQLHFNVKLFKRLQIPATPLPDQQALCNLLSELERAGHEISERRQGAYRAKKAALREVLTQ